MYFLYVALRRDALRSLCEVLTGSRETHISPLAQSQLITDSYHANILRHLERGPDHIRYIWTSGFNL